MGVAVVAIVTMVALVVGGQPAVAAEPPIPSVGGVSDGAPEETGTDTGATPAPSPTPDASATPVPSEPPVDGDADPDAPVPGSERAPLPADPEGTAPMSKTALAVPSRATLPASPIAATIPAQSRFEGATVYDRAVAASRATFPSGARTVLIASGTTYWDAVIAAGLSGQLRAPTLLTAAATVPAAVTAEIRRLAPSTIVVVGSATTVSAAVITLLKTITPDVRRVDGATDFARSLAALTLLPADVSTVYLSGSGYGSAVAITTDIAMATAAASGSGGGALLVNGLAAAADAATIAAMRTVGATSVVIVGTTQTVSAAYEQSLAAAGFAVRRSGAADLNERAVQAAGLRPSPAQRVVVAHTGVLTDIAVAAGLASAIGQPLAFAYYACVPDVTAAYVSAQGAKVIAVGDISWLAPPVAAGSSCSVEKPKRDALLTGAIRNLVAKYGGTYYVTVRELSGLRETYNYNGGSRVEPASMMKIFAAWAALKRVDEGRASLYTMLPSGIYLIDCIAVMIHASDNYCHSDIVYWIGGANINKMIASAGFTSTTYGNVGTSGSVLYAGNRTTTSDLTLIVQRLREGSILSRVNSDRILNFMGAQIWKSRIASGIPVGVRQQTKPGSLWLASGLLQADTGIVYGSRSTVVVSVIATGGVNQAALRSLARTVYSHYNGAFGTAAAYPVQQMSTKAAVAMRSSPGGKAIGTIPIYRLVEVTDVNRMWYKVRFAGRLVWVDFRALRDR